MAGKLEFYYFPLSQPARTVWMILKELGIEYEEKVVDLIKGEQKSEEFKKISLRGKVPAVRDGDFTIAESRAIAGYLVSEYGARFNKQALYPMDTKKRASIDQHLYISENIFEDIGSYVNVPGVFTRGEVTRLEKVDNAKTALGMIESLLAKHTYTVDDHLTLADFFYYVAVDMLQLTDYDDWKDFPKVVAWKKKMAALPYHKETCADPSAKLREMYQGKLKENQAKK